MGHLVNIHAFGPVVFLSCQRAVSVKEYLLSNKNGKYYQFLFHNNF